MPESLYKNPLSRHGKTISVPHSGTIEPMPTLKEPTFCYRCGEPVQTKDVEVVNMDGSTHVCKIDFNKINN